MGKQIRRAAAPVESEDSLEDDSAHIEEEDEEYQSNSDILDSEGDEGNDSESEAGAEKGFGGKKDAYYKDSDVTDSDDSNEEFGADELYREQQNNLAEEDFIDAAED